MFCIHFHTTNQIQTGFHHLNRKPLEGCFFNVHCTQVYTVHRLQVRFWNFTDLCWSPQQYLHVSLSVQCYNDVFNHTHHIHIVWMSCKLNPACCSHGKNNFLHLLEVSHSKPTSWSSMHPLTCDMLHPKGEHWICTRVFLGLDNHQMNNPAQCYPQPLPI